MHRLSVLLLAVLVYLPASAQNAPTVEEIVAKNIQARGGMSKLAAIKTSRATYATEEDGKPVRLVELHKRPNKLRRDIAFAGNTIVFAYDGNSAWQFDSRGKGATTTPPDLARELKEEADIDGPLVNYKEKGNTIELVGKEKLNGVDVYNLKITLKEGQVRNLYLNGRSFLEVRETGFWEQAGKRVDYVTVYKNYRPVQGVLFPFLIEQKNGDEENQSTYLRKIEVNVPIADSFFDISNTKAPKP